ncbi:MAG: hypothetical protein JWM57_168 [Phycisphaerales bacterium]|nr:hypothetical protein [Phycisphaerales bacterium]
MRVRKWLGLGSWTAAVLLRAGAAIGDGPTTRPAGTRWIRPRGQAGDLPIWGIAGGISVGLWHKDDLGRSDGPRGLLRIYTPYLDQHAGRIMNFIAVEPVVAGDRGLSEIEASDADHAPGKRMTALDRIDPAHVREEAGTPARGVIGHDRDVETLSLFIAVEPFKNGAHAFVKLSFRSDRPHEIELATYAAADSRPMDACVLTATMGNFARLRHLKLKDRTVDATEVFAHAKREFWDFFPWQEWPADQLMQTGDSVTISSTGDADPAEPSTTQPTAPPGWRYEGRQAVQTWTTPMRPGLRARVNGRTTFWGTQALIPGGAAYENFELMAPFIGGETYRFAINEVERP